MAKAANKQGIVEIKSSSAPRSFMKCWEVSKPMSVIRLFGFTGGAAVCARAFTSTAA